MDDENICKHFHALCQRKHKGCEDCVIFWGHGGWRTNRLLHNKDNIKGE